MAPADALRVIDFGLVTPLRSQTLWHAIAHGVSGGLPPTISFCRPTDPYVCIGYHRRLEEVDLDWCAERALPVYRRMVGGGPVYLDPGQQFFQITLPLSLVPPSRPEALRRLLGPAVEAFQASGIDAHLDDRLEITVGDRKVCGYGAGQIGEAAVVVGNLIETFDHTAAASILRTPSPAARAELTRLIARYVAATPADSRRFRNAATIAYSSSLELRPEQGVLTAAERADLTELDATFEDPAWLQGPDRPSPPAWQAKVKAGIWVFDAARNCTAMTLGIEEDRVLSAALSDPDLNGTGDRLAEAMIGEPIDSARSLLAAGGAPGLRLAELLDLAEPRRVG